MNNFVPFSGSYQPQDVSFLLRQVNMEMTPVALKEQLIQSGKKHYSDMLSQEPAPSERHLQLFAQALEIGADKLAQESVALSKAIKQAVGDQPIILVSLVRAGVPLGVILQQTLTELGHKSHHYGISIVRDRGIDVKALEYIESHNGTAGIVFVDGWTGKGAITGQLIQSLQGRLGYPTTPRLVVLADLCGGAWLSASGDDWLIPFGIMGAPVSGMVSRSIWSEDDFHGCVRCDHLAEYECSQYLTDHIKDVRQKNNYLTLVNACTWQDNDRQWLATTSKEVITHLAQTYQVNNLNRIKPGIAEATRAVLRRVPDHVLVRSIDDKDVVLLVHLAKLIGIKITEVGNTLGPYRAVTIIKKVSKE
jgi:hypothetical protein